MKRKKISMATLSLTILLVVNVTSTVALMQGQREEKIVRKPDYTHNIEVTKNLKDKSVSRINYPSPTFYGGSEKFFSSRYRFVQRLDR